MNKLLLLPCFNQSDLLCKSQELRQRGVLRLQAAQFYPVGSTVQRYALGLAYQGKTDEAVLQIRRLRDEYWYETDYVPQIGLLIQLCSRKNDTLAAFCTRLKSEKLLVEPGAETQTRPVQMSK